MFFGNLGSLYGCCNDEDCYNHQNISNYGQDHNIADNVWHGENPYSSQINLPALLAARTSGGVPHPHDVSNGINKRDYFDTLASRLNYPTYNSSGFSQYQNRIPEYPW